MCVYGNTNHRNVIKDFSVIDFKHKTNKLHIAYYLTDDRLYTLSKEGRVVLLKIYTDNGELLNEKEVWHYFV